MTTRGTSLVIAISCGDGRSVVHLLNVPPAGVGIVCGFVLRGRTIISGMRQEMSLRSCKLAYPFFLGISALRPKGGVRELVHTFGVFCSGAPDCRLYVMNGGK